MKLALIDRCHGQGFVQAFLRKCSDIIPKLDYRVAQDAKQFVAVVGAVEAAGRKKAIVGKPPTMTR
jgi:hypothetical protein